MVRFWEADMFMLAFRGRDLTSENALDMTVWGKGQRGGRGIIQGSRLTG